MNFPQFWARGRSGDFFAWRWSSKSQDDAQALANQAAQQLAQRFRDGNPPTDGGHYYPNRPCREQILQEHKSNTGELSAVVTRNSYGCLVLNTARVMFVDIDLPSQEPKKLGFFQRLFGKPVPPPPPIENHDSALAKVEAWTRANSDWGWRIYRTRAGLRLLATQGLIDADSATAMDVFEALGADPLYRKLCQNQKCFRARLTPKPWRCGIVNKPPRWPWLEEKYEKRFEKWESQYRSFSSEWATCELIRQIGHPTVHPEVDVIIKLHDVATGVGTNKKLA